MGEAKRRKALDDMYGMGKLPESSRPFVLAMQEIVERQARMTGKESDVRNEHQLFFDGVLNGEHGVYGVGIPAELFDFSEYAFTASIYALTGFLGTTRFGMVMHAPEKNKKAASSLPEAEPGKLIMMLACIDGAWYYNTLNTGDNGTASMAGISDWHQGKVKDLVASELSNRFMTKMAEVLKKSHAQQDKSKATMTLDYLKEHYRANVSAPQKKYAGGDVSIN